MKEWKEGSEVYGIVTSTLGDCRFIVHCEDKVERQCTLKGSFRNRVRVNLEDSVIVSLRVEYDRLSTMSDGKKERGDIVWKYFPSEVSILISNGKISYLKNGVPSSDLYASCCSFPTDSDGDVSDDEFQDFMKGSSSTTATKEDKDGNEIEIDTDLIDI